MLHPHTQLQFISPEKGYGIIATKFIPKGTITWILDDLDRVFTPRQLQNMKPVYREILDTYSYRDNKGNYVLCWDNARFVNHSFKSNCISTAYEFELAVRDIEAGEELTDDYGYLNITEPFEPLPEAGCQRKLVLPDDLVHYHKEWDEKLTDAFLKFNSNAQPLAHLIDNKFIKKIKQIADGNEPMDSILNCYYNPELNGNRVLQTEVH